jgi:hypothetical protein
MRFIDRLILYITIDLMKKTLIIVGTIVGALLLLFAAFMIINGVQRDQAYNKAKMFVLENDDVNSLAGKQGTRKSVTCHPTGGSYGKCQAIEYEVNRDDCVAILKKLKPTTDACNAEIDTSYRESHIRIIAGSLYGTDKLQLQVVVNEPHVLSMYK